MDISVDLQDDVCFNPIDSEQSQQFIRQKSADQNLARILSSLRSGRYPEALQEMLVKICRSNNTPDSELNQTIAEILLQEFDKVLDGAAIESWQQLRLIEIYLWHIIPKQCLQENDLTPTLERLCQDLKPLAERDNLASVIWWEFNYVCAKFIKHSGQTSFHRFHVLRNRASWLLGQQLAAPQLKNLDKSQYPPVRTSSANGWSKVLSTHLETNYLRYCKLLSDLYKFLKDRREETETSLEFSTCSKAIISFGLWNHNIERMKIVGLLLVRMYAETTELGENQSWFYSLISDKIKSKHNPVEPDDETILKLVYSIRSTRPLKVTFSRSNWFRDSRLDLSTLRGIQSRRMVLVSLCKLLILDYKAVRVDYYIPEMLDQLDKLQVAYELRRKQEYLPDQYDLLVTCVEFAFPTPFDNPSNPLYICEFAYFRDTLDYLERNESAAFKSILSCLDDSRKKQLNYYQHGYDKFDVCCSTMECDLNRLKFQCIDHDYTEADSHPDQLCPLLNKTGIK